MSTPFKPDKPFWTKYWRSIYGVPRAWAVKGENLVHAFEAVAAASQTGSMNFDLRDQALMLAGMAIEVQLKALLVNRATLRDVVSCLRKPTDDVERNVLRAFYSHRLADLAQVAGLVLSNEQVAVANSLSQYIYWRGRYVLPTEGGIDDIVPVVLENGLVGVPHQGITIEGARDLIKVVIDEVKAHLYAKA